MMKKIFHFLGGLSFALILIAAAATLVTIGTFLEARFDSHLYASQHIYRHPLFAGLLGLFFINILFSALRRWPFRMRHVPFLITHLGLLMIIAGTILKNQYGLQGHMMLFEGSGSQTMILPHTYALQIERKEHNDIKTWNCPVCLDKHHIYKNLSFPDVQFTVLGYSPHVNETLQTWIKGKYAYILGFPRLPVYEWHAQEPLPPPSILWLRKEESHPWHVLAMRTSDLSQLIEKMYLQEMILSLPSIAVEKSLAECLKAPVLVEKGALSAQLDLRYSSIEGFQNPALKLECSSLSSSKSEKISIPLKDHQALSPVFESASLFAAPRIEVDLKRAHPLLLLVEDEQGDCTIFAFDSHGRVYAESFSSSNLQKLFVYDRGFGGYTVQASIPFPAFPTGRQDKEEANDVYLAHELTAAMQHSSSLAPPLKLLKEACEHCQTDFIETLLAFLKAWQASHQFLMPNETALPPSLEYVLQNLRWKDQAHLKACQWISLLFNQLEQADQREEDILALLKRNKWPFLAELPTEKSPQLLAQIAQQMFTSASQLPAPPLSSGQARLLSAYLKAYDIEYASLIPPLHDNEELFSRLKSYHAKSDVPLILEAPLTLKHEIAPPQPKLEDHHPRLFIEAKKGMQKEVISLAYDVSGSQLKWPILNGEYTVRLQPQSIEIPYRIRLRQARQMNHVNSQQPYSYEGDIAIDDKRQEPIETTLKMNRVYETWDGYRFYLAGMSTTSSGIKRVQLIINQDPFKYTLTYPGGMIVALGIGLLFWRRPYRR